MEKTCEISKHQRCIQRPYLVIYSNILASQGYKSTHLTYTRLTRDTSGDDDNLRTLQRRLEAIVGRERARRLGGGRYVAQVRHNARRVDNIEQAKLRTTQRFQLASLSTSTTACCEPQSQAG